MKIERYDPVLHVEFYGDQIAICEENDCGEYALYEDCAILISVLKEVLQSEPSMDAETGEYGLFVSPETVKMVRKVMED